MKARYRIGVIDDFRNEFSYVDFRDYGGAQVWAINKVRGPAKRQEADDAIRVFLNFKQVGIYKARSEANLAIKNLMDSAPVSLVEFQHILMEGL